MTSKDIARGLAWFGIGLGAVEVLAPRRLAEVTGLGGHERLIRLFGLREIISGVVILVAEDPTAWLWTRVAGDALDGALLAANLGAGNPHRGRTLLATIVVAPVVALDIAHAEVPRPTVS